MLERCNQTVQSLLFGCLFCLLVTSVKADGRVFVLDLGNSSGLQGFRDAEQACASHHARLASAEELHHAVVECFFSSCTTGWLYGGTVGTTVCNVVGSTLKAVDVRTDNATEDTAHRDAFCIRDKGVPCGDPPSFPNARLQDHSGFEMGDELLYACVPGYVMPSGQSAFSLLCDSCGEWYGLVQICVKDETESHIDYEDKFTDSYGEAERHIEEPREAHGEVYEEVYAPDGKRTQTQQETSFTVNVKQQHQDQYGEHEVEGEVTDHGGKFEGALQEGEKNEDRAVEDFVGHPRWEQERTAVVRTDAAATTEAPVSLLSQKHMFWFPSEAFQEEGPRVSPNPVTQTTQRASGAQSEESKEHDSQERLHHQYPVDSDDHDHEQDSYDHDNGDQDIHEDDHTDDQDDRDSHQDEDQDDLVRHVPEHDDVDGRDSHENHDDHNDHDDHDDDHYDMGEHEDDRDRIHNGHQEYDDQDDTYDDHESYEDHDDAIDVHDDNDGEHPNVSEEHPDRDDAEEHYDLNEDDNDHYPDHDDHDDHNDHDDHEDKDDKSFDDHDSLEDDDRRHHVIFTVATNERQNVTQKGTGGKGTTDETWLDGYPVVLGETKDGDSTTEQARPEDRESGSVAKTTDKPNEVDIRRPAPYTNLPQEHEYPTMVPELDQGVAEEDSDHLGPSDAPSFSDTLDYDTQQAAPTHSWQDDLTEHPFLDHGPAPPVHDDSLFTGVMEEHTVHNLPGEVGERGEAEGEMGETICAGEECPPHPPSSSSRGPTVAAIIVALCAIATAVIVGVWCYRRQQQKSSIYEMNGKGQSQMRQGQQIEMQQKV